MGSSGGLHEGLAPKGRKGAPPLSAAGHPGPEPRGRPPATTGGRRQGTRGGLRGTPPPLPPPGPRMAGGRPGRRRPRSPPKGAGRPGGGRHSRGERSRAPSAPNQPPGAALWFPTPLPWGGGPWPPAWSPFYSGEPLGIYVQLGCQAAPGAGRGLVGRGWVSLAGGGGCQCASPPGARPGGSSGWGAGRCLCRGLFPRLPRAGTKAGRFVRAHAEFLGIAVPLRATGRP